MSITLVGFGTESKGTTSVAPTYPTGISANDLVILRVTNKYPSNSPTTPSGWTLLRQESGGAGAPGLNSGTVYTSVYKKDTVTGSESGSVSVSIPSGNSSIGKIVAYHSSYGTAAAWLLDTAGGAQNTGANTWSVSCGNLNMQPNDVIAWTIGGNKQSTVMSVGTSTLTATGITFSHPEPTGENINTSNGDRHLLAWGEVAVSTGTADTAVTFSPEDTSATSAAGSAVLLRIRDSTISADSTEITVTEVGSTQVSGLFTGTDSTQIAGNEGSSEINAILAGSPPSAPGTETYDSWFGLDVDSPGAQQAVFDLQNVSTYRSSISEERVAKTYQMYMGNYSVSLSETGQNLSPATGYVIDEPSNVLNRNPDTKGSATEGELVFDYNPIFLSSAWQILASN